jgi:hypothetical protein
MDDGSEAESGPGERWLAPASLPGAAERARLAPTRSYRTAMLQTRLTVLLLAAGFVAVRLGSARFGGWLCRWVCCGWR